MMLIWWNASQKTETKVLVKFCFFMPIQLLLIYRIPCILGKTIQLVVEQLDGFFQKS